MTLNRNFILAALSPLLPILAMLILNRINQALPLLVVSLVIAVFIAWSFVRLIRQKEPAALKKVLGSFLAVIGILLTIIVIIISGLTIPKV